MNAPFVTLPHPSVMDNPDGSCLGVGNISKGPTLPAGNVFYTIISMSTLCAVIFSVTIVVLVVL